jgi:hypothetical protein
MTTPSRPGVARLVAAVVLAVACGLPASAAGHFRGTLNGSRDTAAGPLGGAANYAGQFGTPDDVDYYFFTTTRDNVSLHFTVRNTLATCPTSGFCQLYATLIDTAGQQLGGEGSSAGTGPVGYAGSDYSTDTIDWTFPTAGRYLLVLDSDGDLPSYRLRIDPADGLEPGLPGDPDPPPPPPPPKGPVFARLSVPSPEVATSVRGALTVLADTGATVQVGVLRTVAGRLALDASVTRTRVARGRFAFRVALSAAGRRALRRRGGLTVSVLARVTAPGWSALTAFRRVTLRDPLAVHGALFSSLRVGSPQRGTRVRVAVTLPQRRSALGLELLRTVGTSARVAGRLARRGLGPGRRVLAIALDRAARAELRRRGRLSVRVHLRVVVAGRRPMSATRRVLVLP